MAVSAVSGKAALPIVDQSKTGFNALNSEDFLKLLITQLQNQDPTEPVGNEELLGQLSSMRSLSANLELESSLKAISGNQNLSTAASFIGKTATGSDANGATVTGTVGSAFLADGGAYVRIGGKPVALSKINSVGEAA